MDETCNLDNGNCRAIYRATASYYILGVAGIIIASVGLLLNSFGLFVVWKIKENHIFQKLIVCLLIFDTILLFFSIIDFSYRGLKCRSSMLVYGIPYIVYPGFYMSLFCSIYMTVCISHERYSALQDPIRYSQIMNIEGYQDRKIKKYVSLVILGSVLYNIFRFFEHTVNCVTTSDYEELILKDEIMIAQYSEWKDVFNCTQSYVNIVVQMNDETIFGKEEDEGTFRTIIAVADSVVLGIVPALLLISFNSKIHCCIQCQRKYIRGSNQPLLEKDGVEIRMRDIKIWKNEVRMALSFIAIVVAFLSCYSIKLLYSLLSAWSYKEFYDNSKRWFIVMEYIGLLLIVVNSTLNILLYGLFGKKFRKEVYELMTDLFLCKHKCNSSSSPSEEVDFEGKNDKQ